MRWRSAVLAGLLVVMATPQLFAAEVDYPKYCRRLRVHGTPWRFSETPANIGIAPELGEHSSEILSSLGYSESDIQGLRERKII